MNTRFTLIWDFCVKKRPILGKTGTGNLVHFVPHFRVETQSRLPEIIENLIVFPETTRVAVFHSDHVTVRTINFLLNVQRCLSHPEYRVPPSSLKHKEEFALPVEAVQHIRKMRGGSQAHLMRCSDEQFYVVKFQNNPQHVRVLANEMLATRLAKEVGLPVPVTEIVEVGDWLIEHTPELHVQLAHNTVRCQAGLQFGSRYVVNPMEGQVFDYISVEMLNRVRNIETFAGILAFDKWTGNADGRQAAFWRSSREKKYTASFIDQGYCFNAGEWTFPDYPLRGVYARNEVYSTIAGWESFEPWISRIDNFPDQRMWDIACTIPPDWYGSQTDDLEQLVTVLIVRKRLVRKLIEDFRHSPRRPFVLWANASLRIGPDKDRIAQQ